MRIVIFILLFAVVFASITLLGRQGGLSNGYQTFVSYGWPQPWLRADVVGIDVTGKNYDKVRTHRTVDWRVFFISVGIAAAITALLSSPLFLSSSKTLRKYCASVLLTIAGCMAVAWAVYPLLGLLHGLPPPDADGWQVWVRMRHPFFVISPTWFAGGIHWRLAEAITRFAAVGIISIVIYGFIRFQTREKPKA